MEGGHTQDHGDFCWGKGTAGQGSGVGTTLCLLTRLRAT